MCGGRLRLMKHLGAIAEITRLEYGDRHSWLGMIGLGVVF